MARRDSGYPELWRIFAMRSTLPPLMLARGLIAVTMSLSLLPTGVLAQPTDAPQSDPPAAPTVEDAEDADVEPADSEPVEPDEPDETDEAPEDDAAADDGEYDETIDDGEYDEADDAVDEEAAPTSTVPDRLPRLQRIGWWNVFASFTLATSAGVLAGLAEREEDRATRVASQFDSDAGQAPLYADRKDNYEGILRRGEAFQTSAYVVGAAAAATAIVGVTFFILDARRGQPNATARRTRVGVGSLEVHF